MKLGSAIAAALIVAGSSAAHARIVLRCLPGHEIAHTTGITSLLGDVPAMGWILANGAKTRPASAPVILIPTTTSDSAALAAFLGVPEDFRIDAVRTTRLADIAQVASRTPVGSPAEKCDGIAILPDGHRTRHTAVLGEGIFGRDLSSSMRITY